MERDFLGDQRTIRRMFIGCLDTKTTKRILRKAERKENREKARKRKLKQALEVQEDSESNGDIEVSVTSSDNYDDEEFTPSRKKQRESPHELKPTPPTARLTLSNFSIACQLERQTEMLPSSRRRSSEMWES